MDHINELWFQKWENEKSEDRDIIIEVLKEISVEHPENFPAPDYDDAEFVRDYIVNKMNKEMNHPDLENLIREAANELFDIE